MTLFLHYKFGPLRGSPSRPLRGRHARFASWGPSAPMGGLRPHGSALRAPVEPLATCDPPSAKPWSCLILSRFPKFVMKQGRTKRNSKGLDWKMAEIWLKMTPKCIKYISIISYLGRPSMYVAHPPAPTYHLPIVLQLWPTYLSKINWPNWLKLTFSIKLCKMISN